MGRAPCCEKVGLKRGPWTPEEDEKLVSYINEHGHGSWRALPKKAGLLRCGKSCRLRWTNYLRPDIKRGEFSASEEHAILQLHALLGNRWSAIASHLPKRTDNEIKNYWNTHLKKRLVKMGLDPVTHKPLSDSGLLDNTGVQLTAKSSEPKVEKQLIKGIDSGGSATTISVDGRDTDSSSLFKEATSLSKGSSLTMHLMQWESVRLEAEARLTQEAQMRAKGVWRRNSQGVPPNSVPASAVIASSVLPISSDKQQGVGAPKAVGAVELMHALHNWEKSLQGQAGVLWPESWKLAAVTNANQLSSCGISESSSSSSPLAADHNTPSTATSLDPAKPSECGRIDVSSSSRPLSPPRKLSWNDTWRPSVSCSKASDVSTESGSASRACGSFSSLMLDAVLGRILVQTPRMESLIDGHHQATTIGENCDVKLEGESVDVDQTVHLNEASNDISAVTGDAQMGGEGACTTEDHDDEEDDDEISVEGTSDLFKDLPRLKRDATTAPVSYTAMLSEEISDYWSNMVLKDQMSSPTVNIAF